MSECEREGGGDEQAFDGVEGGARTPRALPGTGEGLLVCLCLSVCVCVCVCVW